MDGVWGLGFKGLRGAGLRARGLKARISTLQQDVAFNVSK